MMLAEPSCEVAAKRRAFIVLLYLYSLEVQHARMHVQDNASLYIIMRI